MSLSFIAMNRLIEERAATDEAYRRKLERNRKVTLSVGRALPDDALLEKLRSLGLERVDRDWLDARTWEFASAQELSTAAQECSDVEIPDDQLDWVWIGLTCLWERWFPDRPSFEMLDDRMQAGYDAQESGDHVEALRLWHEVWRGVNHLMTQFALPSIAEFDECFGGTNNVFNWVQDYSDKLEFEGRSDVSLVRERRALCRDVLRLAGRSDATLVDVFRRHLAACRAELDDGESDDADHDLQSDDPAIDDIIAELDCDYGNLPEEALRAAQSHRKAVTPRLIELIRNATRVVGEGDFPETDGHFFALFLLTEFQAAEALPSIIEAVSLPDDGAFDLFGDAVTETLGRILAVLAADAPEVIDALFANRSVNEFVRSQAAHAWIYMVAEGRLTRDEAIQKLRGYLQDAIADRDGEGAYGAVEALVDYGPHEALEEIDEAFRLGLIESFFVNMNDVKKSIAEGESRFRRELKCRQPTGIEDTVEELRTWHAFRSEEDDDDPPWRQTPPTSAPDVIMNGAWDDETAVRPSITIHRDAPRVGRNDPCPCGSGRKYKKCCGAGG